MKVEIKEANQVKEQGFPKLMTSKDGFIILATGFNKNCKDRFIGTLISISPIGMVSDEWVLSEFSDFEGSITLSND